ncbi:MAG TPA: alpha/beta hydrolase [Herpetosiphonaceae bacterium]|nr:alpha/beta hydrolase [Herpetosiphonaceae bacterium]
MSLLTRHNVTVMGDGPQTMIFAHGFGCDQHMWRFVAPAFADRYRVILFDHIGAGKADRTAYQRRKYSALTGYADDVLALSAALGVTNGIFVGHSVSAMIGVLAAIKEPERFAALVLIGPSPCYINDGDYVGGFSRADIDGLLEMLDSNYLGWSHAMAPVIMGNPDRPELGAELENSFCRTDPEIARQFARVTFLSDNRADVARLPVPAAILQCSQDAIAPESVGAYLARTIPVNRLIPLRATGHCPNLSAPEETIAAIELFLAEAA